MERVMDNWKTKGVVTLLIKEIKDVLDSNAQGFDEMDRLTEIERIVNLWITANDLHPERAKTMPKALVERIEKGDRSVWDEIFAWYGE